jgi:HTH-type transcriptional regulator/antitoxin HigA
LALLTLLVEQYEQVHYPMDLPDPISAIRFRMDQQGLKNKDLVPFLGSPSKVSEVMAGKRQLSVAMIRNLVHGLGIPATVLIGQPVPAPAKASRRWTEKSLGGLVNPLKAVAAA